MATAKRDFGSFHSSNVEEQIKNCQSSFYTPPPLPVSAHDYCEYQSELGGEKQVNFGTEMKHKHFYIDKDWCYLNHGAFGSTLREAISFKNDLNIFIERQSLRFLDREYFPQLVHIQKRLAEFMKCSPSDIVLAPNATFATNSVLQSLNLGKNSKIYFLNITYGAVKKNLKHLVQTNGVQLHEEILAFPIKSAEEIVSHVEKSLSSDTTLAIFDHISSNYAFTMPIDDIIKVCHKKNVKVLIDGAHSLGTLPIDLQNLNADFYVSNTHKWLCNGKGCAVLYVKKQYQSITHPVVISHGYGSGFQSEFSWTGLNDYSSFLSLHVALNFWQSIGPNVIRHRNKNLLHKVVEMLTRKWNGELIAPLDMHDFMCCVSLPRSLTRNYETIPYEVAENLQNILHFEYKIEVPIKLICNRLCVRVSVHVYNEFKEYEKLANAVLEIDKSGKI